jgi:hypothetical protein
VLRAAPRPLPSPPRPDSFSGRCMSPRVWHRRHDAERDRRDQRQRRGEEQHAAVDAGPAQPRQLDRRRRHGRLHRRHCDGVPSDVPIAASSTLSVRNWRTRRPRLAPIAARTATSRSRTVAREQ